MSSAVSVTPLGDRLCVSMKLRTALPMPARRPFSCVPPEPVGMPFTYERMCSSVASVHCSTQVDPQPFVLVQRERRLVHRLRAALRDDRLQVVDEPFGVLEHRACLRRLVLEDDLQPLVQVARHLEPLPDHVRRRIRFSGRSSRRDGSRSSCRCRAPAPIFFRGHDRLALLEAHLPLGAVALDGGDELFRQRVDDARADAVQAAGRLVIALLELSAGVQHREDHFERAFLRRRMLVHRDAAAIVLDGDGGAVGVQRDADVARVVRSSPRRSALSSTSHTRWWSPVEPTPPMYIPGRFRTGSRPSRTVISFAV